MFTLLSIEEHYLLMNSAVQMNQLISVFTIHKTITIMIIHVYMICGIYKHDNILFLISLIDQFNESL